MDRRSFLTGLVGTTALTAAMPGTALARPPKGESDLDCTTGRPAIGLLDVWWDIPDKRGTEDPDDMEELGLPPGSVWLRGSEQQWRIEKIVHNKRDSVVELLAPMGFELPSVHFAGTGCLHGVYPGDRWKQYEKDTRDRALHARFQDARCGVSWTADYRGRNGPEYEYIKGDVHLIMAVRHPKLNTSANEVLSLLADRSVGITEARFDVVQEVVQAASLRKR